MNILSFYVYNICKIMLKARLTTDNQWIIVESDNAVEMKQLRLSYTKKIPNWYIIKKKASYANVDETFMNSYGMIPKGLWLELVKICKKYNYSLQFTEDFNCRIKNCNITREDFDAFIDNLFSNSSLIKKDYQIDGVFNILQYQNCCAEVSTSGGKTLMTYLLFKYMIDKLGFKHILYVTPKTDLTTQSSDKFADYDKACNIQSNWTYNEIHGAAKKKEEYNETIVFGNYQSLCKKKKEFFDKYDAVIVDECLHPSTKIHMGDGSYKEIQDITPGELVYTYNESLQKTEINEVEFVYKNLSKSQEMYEIEFEDGRIIKITGNHKVLLTSGEWKRVDELKEDDDVLSYEESILNNAIETDFIDISNE